MRRIWKKHLGIALTAVMITGLTGRSGSEASFTEAPKETVATTADTTAAKPEGTEAAKKKDVILTYVVSQNWVNKGSNVGDELNKKLGEETGIKIDIQMIPDDQYVNMLRIKLGTGEVSDMLMVSGGVGAQKFMLEKHFVDLSNEEWVSRHTEYAKQGTIIDGRIMGLMTQNVDGWGILYNKDLYEENGLKVPETSKELCSNGDVLLAKGTTPVYEGGKEVWHRAIWLSSHGPHVAKQHEGLHDRLNKNETKFVDVPEFEQFPDEFKTIYDKGYLGQNSLANTWDAAYEALGTNQAAGYLGYQSYQNEVKDKHVDNTAETWEMFLIPLAGDNMYSHSAGGNMRVAYKGSPNLEYVKELFNSLTREDNLKMFHEDRADSRSNPSFVDVPGKATAAGESILKNSEGKDMEVEYGALYWDNTTVGKYIQEMLLGQKSAKQVLESIDNDRQKMLATTGQ